MRSTDDERSGAGASSLADPERIGPYRILERIGQGGMGVVYLAEQSEPIRRRVALKVIRAGMSTEEVIARFHSERRALALMDHPSIARIYDSGATEQGLPFFVMEYVSGEPLLAYCDRQHLPLEARLELFVQVCRAVQHAHHKGIIHRDLKPSNVLVAQVDGHPVPKVIDFGVAKATDPTQTDGAVFTQTGHLVGTPAYMSPEQVAGGTQAVDTRSDVYSLGVVLYELLTGAAPFDFTRAGSSLAEMQRMLIEDDPPKPSTRLGTRGASAVAVAEHRGLSTTRLVARVRGDLDQVVMKALEKDRTRRYESAEAFARDIERYLADEPVLASPPSRLYVLRKFVARHRVLVGAAGLVVLALVLGTIGTAVGFVRASHQRTIAEARAREAVAAAARAEAARDFVTGMLSSANPLQSLRKDLKVAELLTDAAERLDAGEFASDPDTEYALRVTLGQAFHGVDRFEEAERELRRATELLPRTTQLDPLGPLALQLELGGVIGASGRYAESEELVRAALAGLDAQGVGDHELRVQALRKLADLRYVASALDEGQELARSALAMRERLEGPDSEGVARQRLGLAFHLLRAGVLEEALSEADKALVVLRAGSPRARVDAADGLRQRADALSRLGRAADAANDLREALEIREALFDEESTPLADLLNDMAVVELKLKLNDAAEEHARRALEIRRQMLGEHRDTATSLTTWADALRAHGEVAAAVEATEEALAMRRRAFPEASPAVGDSLRRLGSLQRDLGDLETSERLLREGLENWSAALGEDSLDAATAHVDLAKTLQARGKLDEAGEHHERALAIRVAQLGPTNRAANESRDLLITLRLEQEDWAGAEALLRDALELQRQKGENALLQAYLGAQLGAALVGQGQAEEGEPLLLAGWQALGANPQIWAVNKLFILDHLAAAYDALGNASEARAYRARAEELRASGR